MRRRYRIPGNALEEGREQAGLGELPEDWTGEAGPRPPILTPRGIPTDNPFQQLPVAAIKPPAVRNFNPATHATYNVTIPAGVAIQLFAATRERSYSLIINNGANDAILTYGRAPDGANDGIPLAAAGVGFHELISGTTSTAFVFSTLGTTVAVTEGRYDPPIGA